MKKTLKWILVLCALLPLVVTSGSLVPYISGKTVYFRALMSVVLILSSILFFQSAEFRVEMLEKARSLLKRPLVRAILVSYALLIISTIGAFDRRIAFFGNLERGEGLVGLSFFYAFFFCTALFFEKKDWNAFFGMTLVSGWAMFIGQLVQAGGGNARPSAMTGNPIYLGAYFLFVIYAGLILAFRKRCKETTIPMFISVATVVISVIGIFLTQDRSVILGSVIAVLVSFGYLAFAGKDILILKRYTMRKVSLGLLIFIALFGGTFVLTRHDEVWQHVPGLSRLADFTTSDDTTKARLINTEIALHAVSPRQTTLERSLVGWGWDNFIYAWEKFYDPRIYAYDNGVFDRAHDKILDVIVMTGILGLIAYLAMWWMFIAAIFRLGKKYPLEAAAALFFAIAYFIQNLTVFDSFVTYLMFFAIMAATIYESQD